MRVYKVNKNKRITIPFELRKSFGIEKGTRIYFVEERDGINIFPITANSFNRDNRFGKIAKINLVNLKTK